MKIKSLGFMEAIKKGRLSNVKRHLSGWMDEQFLDEMDEPISPFEYALKNNRWEMALFLFEYHVERWPKLLPTAEPSEENTASPVIIDTPVKKATTLFLSYLWNYRDNPLSSRIQKKMIFMLDRLLTEPQETLSNALLRTLIHQPLWLDWTSLLLKKGANPNAYMIMADGRTQSALSVAALRGITKAVDDLLQAGADATWKLHHFGGAAHECARLTHGLVRTNEDIDYSFMTKRKQCFKRLLLEPHVSEQTDIHGHTPDDVWKAAILRIQQEPIPSDPFNNAARMDVLIDDTKPAPSERRRRI